MTITTNDLADRESKVGKTTASTTGRADEGFNDPELKYPKVNYGGESTVSKAARGLEVKNLNIKNGTPYCDLGVKPHSVSKYPYVNIDETPGGHVFEMNDTPGGDRILIMHNNGAGIEIKPDGSIVVNALNNRVDVVNGDHKLSVEGDGCVTYYGNLKMTVNGDYDLDVKGDMKMRVGGNWLVNVMGSYRKRIIGVMSEIVQKTKSSTVLKLVTETYLDSYNRFVKCVSGQFRQHVQGKANYIHSDDTNITSETKIQISSEDINIAAQSLSLFGDTGTIGGENIIMYSYNTYVGQNVNCQTVTAAKSIQTDTFIGKLVGTAQYAVASKTSTAPGGYGGLGSVSGSHSPDAKKTAKPTQSIMSDYLHNSDGGIREVRVDDNDELRDTIDLKVKTENVTSRPHNVREVRSRLKDQNHLSNTNYTGQCIKDGSLNAGYTNASPNKVGKIRGSKATATVGLSGIGVGGRTVAGLKKYKPSPAASASRVKTLLPDPHFNPNHMEKITLQTGLAPGIPISKFVSSYGDSFTLDHITSQDERKQIARNLSTQVQVMQLFASTNKFDRYNLVVAEGLYKKDNENENIQSGGLKDLAQTGRVVAYELYNASGEQDFEKLYELAVFIKDNVSYEKIILFYDEFDPNNKMNGQIVVVGPQIGEDFSGNFEMKIETMFNGKIQSTNDLVEVIPS